MTSALMTMNQFIHLHNQENHNPMLNKNTISNRTSNKFLYLDKYICFTNATEIRYYYDTKSIMHDKNAFCRYVRNSSGQVRWLTNSMFLFHFTKCFIYSVMILFLFFSICACFIMHMLKHFCSG